MTDHDRESIKQAVSEAIRESGVLTESDVREIVKDTVHTTLERMGIDPKNLRAMSDDVRFVHEWRTTTDAIKNKSILALVGIVVTGFAAALWIGLKALLAVKG